MSGRDKGESRQKAAKKCKVGTSYVSAAKKLKGGKPELFEAVRNGEKSLTEARRAVKEEKREKQREKNRELVEHAPTVAAQPVGADQ